MRPRSRRTGNGLVERVLALGGQGTVPGNEEVRVAAAAVLAAGTPTAADMRAALRERMADCDTCDPNDASVIAEADLVGRLVSHGVDPTENLTTALFRGVSADTRIRMLDSTPAAPFATSPGIANGRALTRGTKVVLVFHEDAHLFVSLGQRGVLGALTIAHDRAACGTCRAHAR